METRIPTRLTPRELRRFGFTVGGPFLLLAALSVWRHHHTSASVFAVVGGLLLLFALVFPAGLGPFQRAWMAMAEALGWFNTRVILTVVWFVVLTPLGWLMRLMGKDPMGRKPGTGGTFWMARHEKIGTKQAMERWF